MNDEPNYTQTYSRLTRWFQGRPWAITGLKLANGLLVVLMYIAYPLLLLELYLRHHTLLDPLLQRAFWVPALSFLVVTVFRTKINRQRPYEAWPIKPLIPRNKHGESMPSRHVFSSTVIAMVYLYVHPPVGALFLLVSLLSAVVRVLAGVHYPTDVTVGFVVGVLSGLFLWL